MSAYLDGGCLRCGAMVSDEDRHDRWHEGMCGHRDRETRLTCMNRPPCNGPHRTDFSPHTWDTIQVTLDPKPYLPLGTRWISPRPTA